MRWGGKMNLMKLAWFNIKKYKGAAASITVLIFFCQLFLAVGIHNIVGNTHLFEDKAQEMESVQNIYCIEENRYREEYKQLLEEDHRVSKVVVQDSIFLWQNTIQLKDGSDYMCNSVLINKADENVLEKVVLEESEESKSIKHPIYVPLFLQMNYGFNVGDDFKITFHQQEYVFQIAGFYETTIFANGNMGAIKYIISPEDYEKISSTYGETKIMGYNVTDLQAIEEINNEFVTKAKVMSDGTNSFQILLSMDYATLTAITTLFPVLLANLLLCFAVIIFITIFIVIRHRITNSIEEQMKNIGTLKALGYTSKQIAGIYVIEYSVLAAIGTVLGTMVGRILLPVVNQFSVAMLGLKSEVHSPWALDCVMILAIIMVIAMISLSKARKVKKIPPVIAFRKGINNHHFKKNYFALEKTQGSVHLRLAAKRFMGAAKQNVIIGVCVTAATAAMMFSVLLYNCIGKDQTAVKKMAGFEVCDLTVNITHAIQAETLKEALLEMSEVRKVNLTHDYLNVSLGNKDVLSVIYPDYQEVETISTYKGRMPIYNNELAITGALANQLGKEIGDALEVEYNGYSMRYLISGISQSMINNGQTLYFTEEGIKQINPSYQSDLLNIYLKEDVDKKAFIEKIEQLYGRSIEAARQGDMTSSNPNMTHNERVKAKAEEKIASLMALYGVDSIDYAIMIDGEMIKGNSKQFAINQITDMEEYIQNNIGAYIQGINWGTKVIILVAGIMIIVIMMMLIKNQLVRQKLDLGIYKGLGYTNRELMLQVTLSLMPAALVGVIGGTILAILASPTILSGAFSVIGVTHMIIEVNAVEVILLGVCIMGFSFITAMLSTYRIKEISAYELLVE